MKMNRGKIVSVVQGSEEWLILRAARNTASEAPAMKGVSKYQSRNDLLKQKATGLVPEIDSHTQRIFDDGHRAEAAARPIAETEIDDELFPVVLDDAEGGFLASMDGLTMCRKVGWEHKSFNASLVAQIDAGQLDEHYLVQLDQQFALSGAERILFTASDGTDANCKHLWIERDESRFADVEAGWAQFEKDLAEYAPAEAEAPKAEGKAPESLPALVVRASGMVEASNLKEFEAIARATLAGINTDLQTDNDFADAEKAVKFCTDVEKRLDGARENVLGQMKTVDEVVRSIDAIKEETRQIRLKLGKAVKDQKESRKLEILNTSRQAFNDFTHKLSVSKYMPAINADFAGAMKGKKTISSLQSACDDEMARAKIEANEIAGVISINRDYINEAAADYRFLFNDFGQLCQKPADDFAAIVKSRIADHKQAEHDRMEAERAKIRAEEEVKARREAEATAQKEAAERQRVADQQRQAEQAAEVVQQPVAERTVQPEVAQPKVAPAEPQAVSRPSDNEIATAIAIHYSVSQATAWIWITEIKTQETA